MLRSIARIILTPIRVPMKFIRWVLLIIQGRNRPSSSETVRNAAGSYFSTRHHTAATGHRTGFTIDKDAVPFTNNFFFFKRIKALRTTEPQVTEFSYDVAKQYADLSKTFFSTPFSLFPSSDLLYEEIESDYVAQSLGAVTGEGKDARFINIVHLFRRYYNDNIRRGILFVPPILLALALSLSILAFNAQIRIDLFDVQGQSDAVKFVLGNIFVLGAIFVSIFIFNWLIFEWPFKTTQIQNLLQLNQYLTDKTSRIAQAYRQSLNDIQNIEDHFENPNDEELADKSSVYTLSFQWLALRLLMCEFSMRNLIFQLQRNGVLYLLSGVILSLGVIGAAFALEIKLQQAFDQEGFALIFGLEMVGFAFAYLLMAYGFLARRSFELVSRELTDRSWFRFQNANLASEISERVIEDKRRIIIMRNLRRG